MVSRQLLYALEHVLQPIKGLLYSQLKCGRNDLQVSFLIWVPSTKSLLLLFLPVIKNLTKCPCHMGCNHKCPLWDSAVETRNIPWTRCSMTPLSCYAPSLYKWGSCSAPAHHLADTCSPCVINRNFKTKELFSWGKWRRGGFCILVCERAGPVIILNHSDLRWGLGFSCFCLFLAS